MKLIIIFVIFGVVSCVEKEEVIPMDTTLNCYIDHLKKISFMDVRSLQSNVTMDQFELCEMILETAREKIYMELYDEFSKNENLNESAICIVQNLKNSHWSDLEIQEEIYELYEVFTKDEKHEKIQALRSRQHKLSNDAIVACMAEHEFGELFDNIFNQNEADDQAHKYCQLKYVFDKKIVDSSYFPIDWDTKFMKLNESFCEILNSQRFAEAEFELKQHLIKDIGENEAEADCLINTYHSQNYFNKTLAIEILNELKVNEEQKLKERRKFIDSMIEITNSLALCKIFF